MPVDFSQLHNDIAAVCPIQSIITLDVIDKSTWFIAFDPAATEAQRAAGQAVLDQYQIPPP